VSIVVVNYSSLHLVQRCIEHLAHLELSAAELIVVDNGSTDGSREWLEQLQLERGQCISLPVNIGFAGACNEGIRRSGGKYVLLLNADAFPERGALNELMNYLDTHLDVGIAGPQLLYTDDRWQRSGGQVPSPQSAMLDALGVTSVRRAISAVLWRLTGRWWRPRSVEYVDGACMLIRRAVLEEIGGLDERFFLFVEDAEFCHRARQHGWHVTYLPQSRVAHLRGGSSSQVNLTSSLQMRRRSESEFVRRTWGAAAEARFLFLRRLNYRWRMLLATALRDKPRRLRYEAAWQAYAQEKR